MILLSDIVYKKDFALCLHDDIKCNLVCSKVFDIRFLMVIQSSAAS
jgi:hypothetical protein